MKPAHNEPESVATAKPETQWTRGVATRKANAARRRAELTAEREREEAARALQQELDADPRATYVLDGVRKFRDHELQLWAKALDSTFVAPEGQRHLAHKLDRVIATLTTLVGPFDRGTDEVEVWPVTIPAGLLRDILDAQSKLLDKLYDQSKQLGGPVDPRLAWGRAAVDIFRSERAFRDELKLWATHLDPSFFSPAAQRYLAHRIGCLIATLTALRDRLTDAGKTT